MLLSRLMVIFLTGVSLTAVGCAGLKSQAINNSVTTFATDGQPDDAVARAILAGNNKPETIFAVRQKLEKQFGGKLKTHIVANRGHDNPVEGSFSFFETYAGPMEGGTVQEGELFIGFFSEKQGNNLAVQQSFEPGLMIELIAWDYTKQMYNFWELVGTGKGSEWHFRGDSQDIAADIARVNMGEPAPVFASPRLRCSGCHTLGTPILKEIDKPNNDWWTTANKLKLGSLKLQPGTDWRNPVNVAGNLFQNATDVSNLSFQVKKGIDRLAASHMQRGQSLKQRLRSLFSTMEMNLASDDTAFEQSSGRINIPTDFFVDSRLSGKKTTVSINSSVYRQALQAAASRFAPDETGGLMESHHAFLVPVRSYSDNKMIDAMLGEGLLDQELVADILAVDITTPVYSQPRLSLLKYVPESASDVNDLREALVRNLSGATNDPAAAELLKNITDPSRNSSFYQKKANEYLNTISKNSNSNEFISDWLKIATQRRKEIDSSDTSKNPRGQITEPGFRVIFPVNNLKVKPGQFRLDVDTGRIKK
jgi:hypothetical protein